jgi:hypothetical protein|tara:strand:- start:849 stop:1178 length:330 start_codon:yes stop_codon:yes gene_type:complete
MDRPEAIGRNQIGDICEALLQVYLLNRGWHVYTPSSAWGPVDVIAITKAGSLLLFDSKADRFRVNPGRKRPARIHRKRSAIQKKLGVRMAYVDDESGAVHFVPGLPAGV